MASIVTSKSMLATGRSGPDELIKSKAIAPSPEKYSDKTSSAESDLEIEVREGSN